MAAIVEPFNVKRLVTENAGRTEDITVREVKELSSFKEMTDEQAGELIKVIKEFTGIVFDSMAKQENQATIVTMQTAQTKNIAA